MQSSFSDRWPLNYFDSDAAMFERDAVAVDDIADHVIGRSWFPVHPASTEHTNTGKTRDTSRFMIGYTTQPFLHTETALNTSLAMLDPELAVVISYQSKSKSKSESKAMAVS